MLKKLGLVATAPMLCLLAVLLVAGFAFRPLPPAPALVVVLNGERLEFPRDFPKLDAEEAILEAEIAAVRLGLTEAYPDDVSTGRPNCPYGCK